MPECLDLHIVLVDHLKKNKERIQKFKEIGDSRYIYQNELDKTCFQHDMSFKDFTRRTSSDKILRDIAFDTAKSPKYDGYQRGLASIVYKSFDKYFLVVVLNTLNAKINDVKNKISPT